MRIRCDSSVYEELWRNGNSVDTTRFNGFYDVEMCSGPIPNLPHWSKFINNVDGMGFSDEKTYNEFTGAITGHNVAGKRVFGKFTIRRYIKKDSSGGYIICLEYDDFSIKDYLVEIAPGLYLGKFFWRGRFYGYFLLGGKSTTYVSVVVSKLVDVNGEDMFRVAPYTYVSEDIMKEAVRKWNKNPKNSSFADVTVTHGELYATVARENIPYVMGRLRGISPTWEVTHIDGSARPPLLRSGTITLQTPVESTAHLAGMDLFVYGIGECKVIDVGNLEEK